MQRSAMEKGTDMIKVFTAYTDEIDETSEAIEQLREGFDEAELLANTVGILYTHPDFIESGVAQAIIDDLPFDVVGMTTMASLSDGTLGMYRAMLTILTSDNCDFSVAITDPVSRENAETTIPEAYSRALKTLDGKQPKLILSFFPYIDDFSGADVLAILDSASGGIPIWGSMSSDMDMTYRHASSFLNKTMGRELLAMVLVSGDISPRFIVNNIPENVIREDHGIISDSEGCLLRAVDGMPFAQYLKQLDIEMKSGDSTVVPILVDYGDGAAPTAYAVYDIFEDGSAIIGGHAPVGAKVKVGEIDYDTIMSTVATGLEEVLSGSGDAVLLLPCVTRYIMLSPYHDHEMDYVLEHIAGFGPYSFAYSGGELCPVMNADGAYVNRFHNYSFSALVL
jgi:hypothetical protein